MEPYGVPITDITDNNPIAPERHALRQYPLVSVEVMNLEALGNKLSNPAQLNRLTRDLMLRLENQLITQDVTIESLRDNVLFFSLREGKDLTETLAKALRLSVALAKKTIPIQDITLQMRVGLDIIQSDEDLAMTAVAERMVAKPGQLVVSYTVYQLTQKLVPYDTIGPLKVQGAMKTFFRVVTEAPAPGSIASTYSEPEPETTTADQHTAKPKAGATKPPPVGLEAPRIERTFEPLETAEKITYEPPVLTAHLDTLRKPNITYPQAQHALETEMNDVLGAREGKILALCGAEGSGKSALIGMTLSKLPQEHFYWLGGNFFESTADNAFPFGFWLDMMQNRLGFGAFGTPKADGGHYLESVMASLWKDNVTYDRLDFFKTLFSLNPNETLAPALREKLGRTIPHIFEFLVALSQDKPVVLVMEDLQYADNASLELLLQMLERGLLKNRIHIILTYTADLMPVGPFEQNLSMAPFKEWVIDAVDEDSLVTIAEPPLGIPWKKLPEALKAQLLEKGSPMFLEEAFRWLLLYGGFSIHRKTGKFMPEKKLKNLMPPEEITQIIQDRFNLLDDMGRSVLQMASAIGERFSTEALATLVPVTGKLDDVMQVLWQEGFIVPDAGNLVRFRHHLIWTIVRNSIEPHLQAEQHQLIADALIKAKNAGMAINPVLIAYQLGQSRNYTQARYAWHEAGMWLAEIGSVTGANIAFRKEHQLMEKAGSSEAEEFDLLDTLALVNLDVYPHYAKSLLLQGLARKSGEMKDSIKRQLLLAEAYEKLGVFSQVVATLHRAQESLPQEGTTLERLALASEEVWFITLQGNYQEALQVYEDAVAPLLRQTGDAIWKDDLFRASIIKAELARARIAFVQCETNILDRIDGPMVQCDLYNETISSMHFRLLRCNVFLWKGSLDLVKREMQALLPEIESLPDSAELMAWWGIVMLEYHIVMEDWDEASMLLPNTAYQAEIAKDYLAWTTCQVLAGRIAIGRGSHDEARNILEQSVTLCSQYHLSQPALLGWQYIAENELLLGGFDVANQFCTRAIEVAQKLRIRNIVALYSLVITQAKVLINRKELKAAGFLLETYWPHMVKSGYISVVAEAAYQISELYQVLASSVPEAHKNRYLMQHQNFIDKANTLWREQGNLARLRRSHF